MIKPIRKFRIAIQGFSGKEPREFENITLYSEIIDISELREVIIKYLKLKREGNRYYLKIKEPEKQTLFK